MSLTTLCSYVDKLCADDDAIIMKRKLQTTAEELKLFATTEKLLSQCLSHLNERALNDGKFAINFALLVSSMPLKTFAVDGLSMRSAMLIILQANFENAKSFKAANIYNFFNSITLLGEYHSRELDNRGAPFAPIANGLCEALATEVCYRIDNYKQIKLKQTESEFAKLLLTQITLNGRLLRTHQPTSIDNLLFEMRRFLIEVPTLEDTTKAFLMMSFDLYYQNFKGLGAKLEKLYTQFLLNFDSPETNEGNSEQTPPSENQKKQINPSPPPSQIQLSPPPTTEKSSGKTTPLSPLSPFNTRIESIGNWADELEAERNSFNSLNIEESGHDESLLENCSSRRNSIGNSESMTLPRERRNFRQRRDSSTHSRHSNVDHRPSSRNQQYNNSNNHNNHHHNNSNTNNFSHYRSANDVSNTSRVSSRLNNTQKSPRQSDLSFNNHYQPPKGGGMGHVQSQPQKPPRFNVQSGSARYPRRHNDSISSECSNYEQKNNYHRGGAGGDSGYGGGDRRPHHGNRGGNQRGFRSNRNNNYRDRNSRNVNSDNNPLFRDGEENWEEPNDREDQKHPVQKAFLEYLTQ